MNQLLTRVVFCLYSLLFMAALPAAASAEEAANPRVRLQTTLGDILLELDPARAPRTVANFLRLVDNGFYDGLIFHRVVANFVIQAGGYDQNMTLREPPVTVPNESFNQLRNRTGSVAMARLPDPDSAASQFFINMRANPSLDAKPGKPGYAVFGQVVAGMDVAQEIELVDTHVRDGMAGVPEQPVIILHATRAN